MDSYKVLFRILDTNLQIPHQTIKPSMISIFSTVPYAIYSSHANGTIVTMLILYVLFTACDHSYLFYIE